MLRAPTVWYLVSSRFTDTKLKIRVISLALERFHQLEEDSGSLSFLIVFIIVYIFWKSCVSFLGLEDYPT
jgi:hypothetical protein